MDETSRAFFRRLFLMGPSIEARTSRDHFVFATVGPGEKNHTWLRQRGNSPVAHQGTRSMSALSIIVASWLVLNAFVIVSLMLRRDQPRAGSKDIIQTPLNTRRK